MTEQAEQTLHRDYVFAPQVATLASRPDGSLILTSAMPLHGCPGHICEYFERWVDEIPERSMLAERDAGGAWRHLTYRDAWHRIRAVGQALVDMGLDQTTPVAILTGNSIEHAVMTYAGMLARVPIAPISPAYCNHPEGIVRLTEIFGMLRPKLVMAQAMDGLDRVYALDSLTDVTWVSVKPDPRATTFASLEATVPGAGIDAAFASREREDIGKILFTSGSTGSPKGVPQTQRMMCSAIHGLSLLVPGHVAEVQVDWMPWHHVMGGNHTLMGMLRDGGTLYIDDGRPTAEGFARTIRNLKEIPITIAQYVPTNIQMLVDAMETDADLAAAFFKRIRWMSYGGAALSIQAWSRLQDFAKTHRGSPLPILSGYGSTETSPGICVTHWAIEGRGEVGLPLPGLELKLIPADDRYELRVRGYNVMRGYLGRPDLSQQAFDEEGFYIVGDAVTFVDQRDPCQGLRFAGRLGENFKLTNGSWVVTSEIRTAVLAAAPSIREVVVAGHGRDDIRLLVWAAGGADDDGERIAEELRAYNKANRAATRRIAAFAVLVEPPSLGAGEVTDKGSVNQRAMLAREADLVTALYANEASGRIFVM